MDDPKRHSCWSAFDRPVSWSLTSLQFRSVALVCPTSLIVTMSKAKLDPLREFLDAVITRIEALEAHVGIKGAAAPVAPSTPGGGLQKRPSVKHIMGTGALLVMCG